MMLFLGAGASKPFGIPTMSGEDGLSSVFEKIIDYNLVKREGNRKLMDDEVLYYAIDAMEFNNLEDLLTVLNDLAKPSDNPTIRYLKSNYLDWYHAFIERGCIGMRKLADASKELKEIMEEQTPRSQLIEMLNLTPNRYNEIADQINNSPVIIENLEKELNRMRILLNQNLSKNLKSKIIEFIKKECNINEKIKHDDSIKADIKDKYDRLFKILENCSSSFNIFTTNYDTVIEKYIETKDKFDDFYDGFTYSDPQRRIGDWDPERYDKNKYKIKLLKLHGSIDQYIYKEEIIKTPLEPSKLENAMIYPMREKEVYKDPFFELFTRLKTSLRSEKICIIIGYSFGDEHIRNVFFDAVKRNPEIRIFLINPNAKKIRDDLEPIKDNIEPIEGKFGEESVFEELKQKLAEA